MKNIFKKEVTQEVIERINKLQPNSKAVWGKMDVAQMLAHLNVQYELVYEPSKFPNPNFIARFFLKTFVKKAVVGDKAFPKNGRTAPYFVINETKDFENEKERLINYLKTTQKNGVSVLLPNETKSFGKLTAKEWNTLFYKHINHHLQQFGV